MSCPKHHEYLTESANSALKELKKIDISKLLDLRVLDSYCGLGLFRNAPDIKSAYFLVKTPRPNFPDLHDLIGLEDMKKIVRILYLVGELQKAKAKAKRRA